jgi:hypothetical protein
MATMPTGQRCRLANLDTTVSELRFSAVGAQSAGRRIETTDGRDEQQDSALVGHISAASRRSRTRQGPGLERGIGPLADWSSSCATQSLSAKARCASIGSSQLDSFHQQGLYGLGLIYVPTTTAGDAGGSNFRFH